MQRDKHQFQITSHSFKCFLKSCVEFNNGLFYIFSGPLFANLEGYVYFDLLIWGLSPLTFIFLRPKITEFMKEGGHKIKGTTLRILLIISIIMTTSYFFLNYSSEFNWNYFSRTFNLNFGYFVFDMLLRTFDLIIDLQEEEQSEKQCEGYCEIQHAGVTLAYVSVFFLASTFQVNQRNNGPIIFGISCIFSCLAILLMPTIYYLKHREHIKQYRQISQSEEILPDFQTYRQNSIFKDQQNQNQDEQINRIAASSIGLFLISCSLLLNMNYFSLWMMEPLNTDEESSYQQYNITIQMVSGFFLISSIGNYISVRMFVFFRYARIMSKVFLFIYAIFIMLIYDYYQVNYVSILVTGFGFHYVCTLELGTLMAKQYKITSKFYLYSEVFTYFILPLFCTILNIGQQSLGVYALISGSFLAAGALLI